MTNLRSSTALSQSLHIKLGRLNRCRPSKTTENTFPLLPLLAGAAQEDLADFTPFARSGHSPWGYLARPVPL
jgi:hypothetical protein